MGVIGCCCSQELGKEYKFADEKNPLNQSKSSKSGAPYSSKRKGFHIPVEEIEEESKEQEDRILTSERFQTKIEAQNFVSRFDDKLTDHYKVIEILGRGAFGRVEKVEHLATGDIRAAKYILVRRKQDAEAIKNEIQILKGLDHPNILKIYEYFIQGNMVILVTELLDGGNLLQRIVTYKQYSEQAAGIIMWQLLSAISYIHQMQIQHSDIKPENIMMESYENKISVKLIDFGVSRRLTSDNRKKYYIAGTEGYMAPEQAKGNPELKSDIWGLGVILYILLSGEHPFEDRFGRIKPSLKFPESTFKSISPSAIDLTKAMLQRNPEKRISAKQAFQHKWIKTTSKQSLDKGAALAEDSITNLKQFQLKHKLQKAVLLYLATHFEIADIKEAMKMAFSSLDKDGNGRLSRQEIKLGLINMGRSPMYAQREVDKVFQSLDFNESNYIDYSEFIAANLENFEIANDKKLRACFARIDKDGDGYLDFDELRSIIFPTLEKESITPEDRKLLEDMLLSGPDKNEDGRVSSVEPQISLNEFMLLMKDYKRRCSDAGCQIEQPEDTPNPFKA